MHPSSSIPHLDQPSQSEEMVHADRLPAHADPLKKEDKANLGAEEFSRGEQERERRRKEKSVLQEGEGEDAQHPVKSGLPHLEQPSLSEGGSSLVAGKEAS
mgnify:FL=1